MVLSRKGLGFMMMCHAIKRTWKSVFFVLAALLFVVGAVDVRAEDVAEEERPAVSLYVDALSQYVFRGVAFSNDSVVLQPSMTVSYKGFSANIWGNFDTCEDCDEKVFGESPGNANWNETDFTFSYTHELYKNLNGSIGGVYYALVGDDSFEVFGGLSYALPWFTVAVTGYREVSHFPGWWLQFDISRNFPLPWYSMSVDLGATFGFQSQDADEGDYEAWHNGQVLAALNIPVCKWATISPRVGVSFPLTSDASEQIESLSWDGEDTHVFGGIRVAVAF